VPAGRIRRTGGFGWGFFALELRRMLRNRRTMMIALIVPPLVFLSYGTQSGFRTEAYGSGNMTAYAMVSMALYGAMLCTTSGGATVAVERASGWSRQLRLTPLRPVMYIVSKIMLSMLLGFCSSAVVFTVGAVLGAHLTAVAWVSCFLIVWAGSIIFAALGLFLGYLLPASSIMQILGLLLAILGFAGGLFFPLHGWIGDISRVFPTNGVATLARVPFGGSGDSGLDIALAVVNVVFWAAAFTVGSTILFRRDTAR
jgi:ABC-2 type transport system permease protein